MLLALLEGFDWQGGLVFLAVLGALSYLLLRGRSKKKQGGCGSKDGACGCVKSHGKR